MKLLLLAVLAACGRLDFNDTEGGSSIGDSGIAAKTTCGAKATAPASITIAGDVFQYTDFTNDRSYIANGTVDVIDGTTTLATATSAMDGSYTTSISTGGVARSLILRATVNGMWPTETYSNGPIDRDLSQVFNSVWRYGEITVWGDGAMGSIYSALDSMISIDPARSTINVTAANCDGSALEGVTFTLDPPAEGGMYYLNNGGVPSGGTVTTGIYTDMIASNIPLGPMTITAEAPGLAFAPITVDVQGPLHNLIVLMQPLE
ncbi:MAG: hypothetical protein QM831_30740 [Kofleriaceae bacterium]